MKVLFVIDSLGAGGAEQSTALLLPRLVERGAEVSVVTLYTAVEGNETSVRDTGITVRTLTSKRFAGRVRELRSILRTEAPDVVHTALYAADQVGRVAATRLPVKVVSSFVNVPRTRELAPENGPPWWKTRIVNAIDAATGHVLVDRFHAVTPGVARSSASAYRLSPDRITVVERGRDPDHLGSREPERRDLVRSSLDIDADTTLVLAAGRHEHQKAHVDLVKVIDLLVDTHPRTQLVIAGRDGNASQALREEIAARPRAAERIRLLGHRSDVADLLVASDIMALSSRFEGTAGIALEAMALGTPIVSTRLEGMDGILVDDMNALLADVGDVAGLAHAVARIVDEPGLGVRLASAARQDFEDRFTLDQSAERMLALYSDVVGRPG